MNETEIPNQPIDRPALAHRIVQAGLFLSLIWKWSYFRLAVDVYAEIPLDDPFFPDPLRSVIVLSSTYLVTVAAIVISFITGRRAIRQICAWLTIAGATILCIHQGSYNDMTFVTAWWTSLWSIWYVHRNWDDDQNQLLRRAAFLSRLILSVILLGGAIGKWTPEYWSGEVFHDIYFRERNYWLFNGLRETFAAGTLRQIATWYSRQVIVIESLAGFGLWLLPASWAAIAGVVLLISIALLSNFLLFSVLACLIALSTVGLLVPKSA